jgi:hypothetical protein
MTNATVKGAERRIGILVGRESSWPPAFIAEVNNRKSGVTAEFVMLGAEPLDHLIDYDVVVDRISHEVPFYRTWLKQAALQGVKVINNPFMWAADDKFFGANLAEANGVRCPKTIVLPNKGYIPGLKPDESLRNLTYPLHWQGVVEYVGLPCILKDAHGGGWRDVYVCHSLDELLHYYDHSGLLTMIVQELIAWQHYVRCICIGRKHVLPIRYDPRERKYHVSDDSLPLGLRQQLIDESLQLVRALGYDMNSVEWAVRDGVPYAIDFMNPAPDFDLDLLTPTHFEWVVRTMADVAMDLALAPKRVPRPMAADLFAGTA